MIPVLVLGSFAVILLGATLRWLLGGRQAMRREEWQPGDRIEPVDRELLEAAEREVQGRGPNPEEEEIGDDWGPGASPHR